MKSLEKDKGPGRMARNPICGLAVVIPILTALAVQAFGQGTLKDDQGYVFPVGPPPQRIVSLAPNITEILFDLGLGAKVVGVTRYCDHPPEALAKPKIGGMIDPDLEKIRALSPDLIIAFRGNPLPAIQRMRDLRLPVFVLEEGETLESLFPFLEKIGGVTQRQNAASSLIQRLKSEYDRVEKALRHARTRPRLFLAIQGLGFWTSGQASYLTDLVEKAGGASIAGRITKRWVEFSREQLLQAEPEVFVLLVKSDGDFEAAQKWLTGQASLQSLPAIRNRRIFSLDENETSRYGPRLFSVLADFARRLHPECFGRRDSAAGEAERQKEAPPSP